MHLSSHTQGGEIDFPPHSIAGARFGIVTPGRTFALYAETEAECARWLDGLYTVRTYRYIAIVFSALPPLYAPGITMSVATLLSDRPLIFFKYCFWIWLTMRATRLSQFQTDAVIGSTA